MDFFFIRWREAIILNNNFPLGSKNSKFIIILQTKFTKNFHDKFDKKGSCCYHFTRWK